MRVIAALLSAMMAVIAMPLAAQVGVPLPMSSPDEADAILAAIRVKGYRCDMPTAMAPDFAAGARLEPAWLVTCETGRYRVTFVGDTGPLVEPLN
jgi:hypothetical protein